MPLIVDPSKQDENGVGQIFRAITLILSISLPLIALSIATLWGYRNGFGNFF
tara:strand:+ start:220 stop:375 length:156 start_codon:yes stop_codon:yes gene_type:complete